ncbi:MAG TPA: 2-oxo acid dehydrogenase subunit E2 [Anaerolineae bacterium]|nr:2-oxo acid dehydrogenase subunit E2 [Anaerolineae bacterium]
MITKVIMPQGGQDLEKGTVVRWLKQEDEPVKKGEIICEVETEKAVFEVEAPADGYLRKIVVQTGMEAAIFSVIGLVGDPSDSIEGFTEGDEASSEQDKDAQNAGQGNRLDKATIISPGKKIIISPKAKRIAKENQVPINKLKGTGSLGRIVVEDVLAYLDKRGAKDKYASVKKTPGGQMLLMGKIKQVTAQRMSLSKQTVPHFYVTLAVDMTRALKVREEINQESNLSKEEAVAINDFIIKACALALNEFKEINASFSDKEHIILWEDINIGIAVSHKDGVIVPVIKHPHQLPLLALSKQIRQLVNAAREGKQISIVPGRFTISNLGMHNVDNFSAIINPPETGILAVSTIRKTIGVMEDNSYAIRDMMNLTLSIDHRVCDGVLACKFINRIKDLLETPKNLLN